MGQYCFARWRLSSSVVCNATGVQSGRPPGALTVGAPATGPLAVSRPTLHGGPVRLRPVRATPCFISFTCCFRLHLLVTRAVQVPPSSTVYCSLWRPNSLPSLILSFPAARLRLQDLETNWPFHWKWAHERNEKCVKESKYSAHCTLIL